MIKAGDKVEWKIKNSEYQGVVEVITAAGNCALVRQKGKRLELVPLEMLKKRP